MNPSKAAPPIIIKRVKAPHAAHHGGAWKVAYADFVTAMMALFIVLWLQGANEGVKKAVGAYFRDPSGKGNLSGSDVGGTGDSMSLSQADMPKLKQMLENALRQAPQLASLKNHVEMTITGEGLRIEMLENESGVFFQSGNSVPTPVAQQFIATFALELGKLKNPIMIEGHTDSKPFASRQGYSNWELSAERANAARRIIEASGVSATQVSQVRGFADRRLRHADKPEAASNRRVSVIVQSQAVGAPAKSHLRADSSKPKS